MDRFSSGLRRRATLIFALGLLTWAGVQGALINIPLWTRALPPEPDDAYIYLSKAPQMAQCFIRQDCPALEDLRTQTDQAGKPAAIAWEASRARVTAFTVYHPLHSALILGLHASGLSWETAYKVLCSAGAALFLLGLGLLLHALVGPGPAGAALFLLAFQIFPGQGLHYVVPSNLALGIAMVVWARILARRGDCPWCLTLGTAAMLGMHPAGLLYSLVSLLLAFLNGRGAPRPGRRFAALAATALLTALGFILPLLSTHPELARAPEPLPDGFNPWMFALNTLREILGSLDRFTASAGAAILILALLTGLRTMPAQRRTVLGRYCACVGLFLVAGLFHIMPHYPAEVFIRVWIPMAVGLAALAGYGLFKWLDLGVRLLDDRDGPLSDSYAFLAAPLSRRSLGMGLLLVLTAVLVQTARTGADMVLTAMDKASSRYDYAYNFEQPALLLAHAAPGDRVLYTSLFSMPFYFTHGALDLGAVYLPAVRGTDEARTWLHRDDLRFAVLMSPLRYIQTEHRGRIPAQEFPLVRLEAPDRPRAALDLSLANRGEEARLHIRLTSPDGTARDMEQLVPARWTGRVSLPLADFPHTDRLELALSGNLRRLDLRGIAFDGDAALWPWKDRARLVFVSASNEHKTMTIPFDLRQAFPDVLGDRDVEVLDDAGTTLLVRLR